ncbi:Transglutaminase-like_superfamily protein [Hexamita inflata]|uniref:Transglutaminase-like superfamily protein n=1 Tax=Hexamita inflata TaxID=28002 RepID=A0AA86Q2L6_9EUKA|nr:Transglutaminase-like superfamily protein [Hexamita inflata]
MKIIELDYPELWFIKNYTYRCTTDGFVYVVNIFQNIDIDELFLQRKALNSQIKKYVNQEILQQNDLQKEYYIQSILRKTVTYNLYENQHIRDIIGCLVNRQCVCAGFALSFKYLGDLLNLKCNVIHGYGSSGHHAWNQIYLGNHWYHVDPTWNKDLLWFNVDDRICFQSHSVSNEYNIQVPKCNSMVFNYFSLSKTRIIDGNHYEQLISIISSLIKRQKFGIQQIFFDCGVEIAQFQKHYYPKLSMELSYMLEKEIIITNFTYTNKVINFNLQIGEREVKTILEPLEDGILYVVKMNKNMLKQEFVRIKYTNSYKYIEGLEFITIWK